jgi:hypothetical protein
VKLHISGNKIGPSQTMPYESNAELHINGQLMELSKTHDEDREGNCTFVRLRKYPHARIRCAMTTIFVSL